MISQLKRLTPFLTILMPCLGFAQTVGKTVLYMPPKYIYPTGDVERAENSNESKRGLGTQWFVYSDRSNNTTFERPDGQTEKTKMNFLDVFAVIEQTEDYIHIVKVENTGDIDPETKKIKKPLPDYGWAPKTKMLLWPNALVDRDTRFTVKALAVNSLETLNDTKKYADDEKLKLYVEPSLNAQSDNDVRLYDFLYVYKKEGNSWLIGKTPSIRIPYYVSSTILGWVDKGIITEWKQRLVLEPNPQKMAALERRNKNVKPSLFGTQAEAEKFKLSGVADKPMWSQDLGELVPQPAQKRFPIIETFPNGVIKTGLVSAVYDLYGNEVIKSEEQVEIEKEYNTTRDKFRNVNIIFVMDGSELMRDYKASMYELVYNQVKLCEAKKNEDSPYKFKLGAVIYRDASEKNCPGEGDISIQQRKLTSDYPQFISFMNNNIPHSCSDKDYYQYMYQGMETACRMLDGHEYETNMIVLMGSGGNRESEENLKAKITDMLVKYQVSILAFQVKNTGEDAQVAFADQVRDLVINSTDGIRRKMNEKMKRSYADLRKKPFVQQGLRFRLLCPESSPIPGTMLFTDVDNPMHKDSLNAEVSFVINKHLEVKEDILSNLDSKLKGIGKRTVINEGMYLFLSNMNVDVELLAKASNKNVQFFTTAYTTLKSDKMEYPYYRYCLFMTNTELSNLTADLGKIFNLDIDASQMRGYIKDALRQTVINYFGADRAKKIMSKMTAAELMQTITGLPTSSPLFKKYTIDDFTDPKKVSDQELERIREEMGNKLTILESLGGNPEKSFRSADMSYYWIPQEYLP
jgi:hypothetical protein